MSCDGNCAECPIQCGASKVLAKINAASVEYQPQPSTEKEQSMCESVVKVAGCGAPSDVEDVRQNAAILHLQEQIDRLGKGDAFVPGFKVMAHITLFFSVISFVVSVVALCMVLCRV